MRSALANEQALAANPCFRNIVAHHVKPTEAGEVFTAVKPKLAVYSRLVFVSDTKFPRPTVDTLIEQTRKTYAGPLVVGQDLMSFTVGDEVATRPSPRASKRRSRGVAAGARYVAINEATSAIAGD